MEVRRRAVEHEPTTAAIPAIDAGDKSAGEQMADDEPDYYPPETDGEEQAGEKRIDDAAPARVRLPVERVRWGVLALFVLAAAATRLFRISRGDFVVWDEAHFGKFASHYLTRAFYFDVHPPLGKMLVALAGRLAGWDGTGFDFGSGKKYAGAVDYVAMRTFVALFGAAAVPLAYVTALQLRMRHATAVLVAAMVLLESGLVGISRLILLDAFLLGFTALTVCGYAAFRNQRPFSAAWAGSLLATGVGIGCVSSVKWVGLFPTALVGLLTVEELLPMLAGPRRLPRARFAAHFGARALCLIAVPAAIYVGSFAAHFAVLSGSGTGDGNMSSLFQAGLAGSDLSRNPVRVVFGSLVTVKSQAYGGGLLHSHVQRYPAGSLQQQVTTYHHKDANNHWVIVPADPLSGEAVEREVSVVARDLEAAAEKAPSGEDSDAPDANIEGSVRDALKDAADVQKARVASVAGEHGASKDTDIDAQTAQNDAQTIELRTVPVEYAALTDIVDGAVVRLMHKQTGAMLHSHAKYSAPLTAEDYEVTGYGRTALRDANDLWAVEIVREAGPSTEHAAPRQTDGQPGAPASARTLRALTTTFRLRHVHTGCYLRARNTPLPEWGFKQGEVSCQKPENAELAASSLLWNVETHVNDLLPAGSPAQYRSRFADDLRDINVGMWMLNNALTPDPELEPGQLVSRAADWFLMRRGIRMCSWADDAVRFYMLGNPAVWWTSSLAIVAAAAVALYCALVRQRGAHALLPARPAALMLRLKITAGGWALVYVPFFIMGRVLYVHHYYPALYFAVLAFGVLWDAFVVARMPGPRARLAANAAVGVLVAATFVYFAPMCYGMEGPARLYHGRRWLRSWNL